jgi:hypothetical protein
MFPASIATLVPTLSIGGACEGLRSVYNTKNTGHSSASTVEAERRDSVYSILAQYCLLVA